jgi:hypothetical protein
MEQIVTALLPDRESANRLATDIMADCRCRRTDIAIDARGLASASRDGTVLVTVRAIGNEAAFCVSELMRRHNARSVDARSVTPGADDTEAGTLWGYTGPDRRGRREPWTGSDRRRG